MDLCKVGISKSSKKRVKNIQTGCPVEIEVRYIFESKWPHKVEKSLHRQFNRYKNDEYSGMLKGEWFSLPVEEILGFLETCKRIEGTIDSLKAAGNPFI